MNRYRRALGALLLAIAAPCPLWAGAIPAGSEFQVNSYTTGSQYPWRGVTTDALGNFVAAWSGDTGDGSSGGVSAQRYASSGTPLGSQFQVNTYTTSNQSEASVSAAANGDFVVVWSSFSGQDGSFGGVFGQRYASSGAAVGTEFQVNSHTTSFQRRPAVAASPAGDFVVAWESDYQDGSAYGVYAQRYASSGSTVGTEFRVNTTTFAQQRFPSIAMEADGGFVVAWGDYQGPVVHWDIKAQRYASSGAAIGTEFRVNTFTTGSQFWASVSIDAAGDFVVVWQSNGQDGSSYGVFGQRYASSGAPAGTEFRVNSHTTGDQRVPSVSKAADGQFVVTFEDSNHDGAGGGAFAQRYTSSGGTLGTEFRVNTYTTGNQFLPSVSATANGDFVVVWASDGQDGSSLGVFAQRYQICGNGAVGNAEQCDDGNEVNGDCCSALCQAEANGNPCADGLYCNGTDSCSSGACSGHSGDPCPGPDGDSNCAESCDEGADACTAIDPNGSSCDDGLFCTATDTCSGGSCGGTGDPCPGLNGDGNCAESCDEGADACTGADPNGSSCDDGLFCTTTDTCGGGICGGVGDPCSGADGDGDCSESCDEGADACSAADPNGSSCDDGLFCTASDTCAAGSCGGVGDPCPGPDGDASCVESCDEAANSCTAADPDGAICDDGNAGTGGDQCLAGSCSGTVASALDHYKCYQGTDLKNPKFNKVETITTDQVISGELFEVLKLKYVCAPVDKNGEGIGDPTTHLICYQGKSGLYASPPQVEVSTQFQTSRFEFKKAKLLCVPGTTTVLP